MRTIVLDAGALIALERRDDRMLAIAHELIKSRHVAHVPAGVVAQVWRGSPRQHAVARLMRSGAVRVHPLSEETAYRIGRLLGETAGSDVVDAHVALLGSSLAALVVTSDPADLKRLAPDIDIVEI